MSRMGLVARAISVYVSEQVGLYEAGAADESGNEARQGEAAEPEG